MWLETLFWLLLVLLSGAGTVAQTVAASVHDLPSSVLATETTRVRRVKSWGGVVSALATAGAGAVAVLAITYAGGDSVFASVGAAVSILMARAVQSTAREFARDNFERLAAPLLGDAVAFLSLVEPRESPEPEEAREETVAQMVDASAKAGLIESDEREMITGILHLDRTLTREIMVPRIDVIAVDVEMSLNDALDVVISGAHARVPVFEESIDHVVGLLYAKDLLKTLRDRTISPMEASGFQGDYRESESVRQGKTDVSLRSLLRPAYFVPESKPLDELLQELQRTKVHMAIVVDEYGGTAGIVTIEDVLEEIVGEIQDEYDTGEEPLVERMGESEAVFDARVNIDEVNETLSVNLSNESDTLGGLVYNQLGKMPKVGDQVRSGDVVISVLSVVGRRIKKIRVTKTVSSSQHSVTANRQATER